MACRSWSRRTQRVRSWGWTRSGLDDPANRSYRRWIRFRGEHTILWFHCRWPVSPLFPKPPASWWAAPHHRTPTQFYSNENISRLYKFDVFLFGSECIFHRPSTSACILCRCRCQLQTVSHLHSHRSSWYSSNSTYGFVTRIIVHSTGTGSVWMRRLVFRNSLKILVLLLKLAHPLFSVVRVPVSYRILLCCHYSRTLRSSCHWVPAWPAWAKDPTLWNGWVSLGQHRILLWYHRQRLTESSTFRKRRTP